MGKIIYGPPPSTKKVIASAKAEELSSTFKWKKPTNYFIITMSKK